MDLIKLVNRREKITESTVEQEYITEMRDYINEPTFLNNAKIRRRFIWWPKRCRLSQSWIWLEFAIQARITSWSQSGVVFEDRYYKAIEFTMYQLKESYNEFY